MVFLKGESGHISTTPLGQVSGGGVVGGMILTPDFIGGESENTYDSSHPIVGQFVSKESAMSTVMLDTKKTNQKKSGRDDKK